MNSGRATCFSILVAVLANCTGAASSALAQNACCEFGEVCTDVADEAECIGLNGVLLAGEDCATFPCAPGACCTEISCGDIDAYSCITAGRDFIGGGLFCADDPCNIDFGVCCMGEVCESQSSADCALNKGVWLGVGTHCDQNLCDIGACCTPGACAEIPLHECLDVAGEFSEPDVCSNNICTVPPVCAEGILFGQPAAGPDFFAAGVSEMSAGLQRFENYTNVSGPIDEMTWWGLDLAFVANEFIECVESDPTFNVSFHEDNVLAPGPVVCSYSVTATRTPLPLLYDDETMFQLNEYHVTLPTTCVLTNGWVSIVGEGDPDCLFLWMSSDIGGDVSYCDTCDPQLQTFDLGICLDGTVGGVSGSCCDYNTGGCDDEIDIADCSSTGLNFDPDTICDDLMPACATATGGCCESDGNCDVVPPSECGAVNGSWLGPDTNCDNCPSIGACCLDVDDCQISSEFDCLLEGFTWVGQGSTCLDCPDQPDCPVDSLTSQPPDGPLDFLALTSELSSGFFRFDEFFGVGGAIGAVTWWGFDLIFLDPGFLECIELDETFDISFHEDAAGVPGAEVCSYTLTTTSIPVGFSYGGTQLNEYNVTLPTPCVMTDGWISIVGLGDPDCWFFWISSPEGNGTSYCEGCLAPVESEDISYCLHGALGGVFGACCDESTSFCDDGIEITECLGVNDRFVEDVFCDDLDPECGIILGACCFDDGTPCATVEQAQCDLDGGTWLGAKSLCDQCPCVTPCPAGGIPEGEPVCEDEYVDLFNDGCDAEIPVFSHLELCDTICGESGTFAVGLDIDGDTDWYEVEVSNPTELRWRVETEFPAIAAIVDGNNGCEDPTVLSGGSFDECVIVSVVATVEAGTYWPVVAAPTANDLAICGARYTATISATPIFSYGDINRDGSADADDLICMLDGLSGQLDCLGVTVDYLDIAPCGGGDEDGNLRDLLALLDTLAGELLCPESCP